MIVNDVIESVLIRYNDTEFTRLSQSQYLKFLDDAIAKLILVRPDAHVKTAVVGLSEGTRQSIPADGYALIDIYMNKIDEGSGTYSNGAPVLQVERKDLDYFSSWHTVGSAIDEIDEFAYDTRSPRTFWVSPPLATDNSVYVEMDYSYGHEVKFATVTGTFADILEMDIDIEDIFKMALIQYMLYLCFSTDSSAMADMQLASSYEQSFFQGLGIEYQASLLVQPRINIEVTQ